MSGVAYTVLRDTRMGINSWSVWGQENCGTDFLKYLLLKIQIYLKADTIVLLYYLPL